MLCAFLVSLPVSYSLSSTFHISALLYVHLSKFTKVPGETDKFFEDCKETYIA